MLDLLQIALRVITIIIIDEDDGDGDFFDW